MCFVPWPEALKLLKTFLAKEMKSSVTTGYLLKFIIHFILTCDVDLDYKTLLGAKDKSVKITTNTNNVSILCQFRIDIHWTANHGDLLAPGIARTSLA